jgi:hypothetical protein
MTKKQGRSIIYNPLRHKINVLPTPPFKPIPKDRLPWGKPVINIGIFFDGTDNNRDRDKPKNSDTNVSKLYDLFQHDEVKNYAVYLEGVATGDWIQSDSATGMVFGRGIQNRVERACRFLKGVIEKCPDKQYRIFVFGFSRGSATALSFINQVMWNTQGMLGMKEPPFKQFWFVGLFDTVGSIAIPGTPLTGSHNLSAVYPWIRRLVHFTAQDERRMSFPLTSVKENRYAKLPENWRETVFPGVHSDVGGGYNKDYQDHQDTQRHQNKDRDATVVIREKNTRWNYLSRVACWAMYDAAVEGCAPMREIHVDAGKPHEEVEFAKFFGAKFNDESPDSGWTIFNLKSTENIALQDLDKIKQTLNDLKIPSPLAKLWLARKDDTARTTLSSKDGSYYRDNIKQYVHDSLTNYDPNTYVAKVTIPFARDVFYEGTPNVPQQSSSASTASAAAAMGAISLSH